MNAVEVIKGSEAEQPCRLDAVPQKRREYGRELVRMNAYSKMCKYLGRYIESGVITILALPLYKILSPLIFLLGLKKQPFL